MPAPHRDAWALDPDTLHLNHGSFGAVPTSVLRVQDDWRRIVEADPTGFFEDRYEHELELVRGAVARFVGARPDRLVMVPNASAGVASVVDSFEFRPSDEILITDHAYNACRNMVEVAAARTGARVVVAHLGFPAVSADHVVTTLLGHVTAATRLVVVDHVTSVTALALPIERIVHELEPDVPVLVDGAHAPGMVGLDIDRLGASFYAGNLHKWVCAPRGAGFLVAADRHHDMLRPGTVSHGWNREGRGATRFLRLYAWTGTFDPSSWLSVPSAIDAMAEMDDAGWPGVMAANRRLALAARDLLSERVGQPIVVPDGMIGSMATIVVPGAPDDLAARLRALGIVVLASPWPDTAGPLMRISAQRYNDLDQYGRLADAVSALR